MHVLPRACSVEWIKMAGDSWQGSTCDQAARAVRKYTPFRATFYSNV